MLFAQPRLHGRPAAEHGEDDRQDDAHDREYPGDVNGSSGDPGKSEHRGDQGNDKKRYGP